MAYYPDNVVLHIFSYLQPEVLLRARQVCWQWKYLAENESLWSAVHLSFREEHDNYNKDVEYEYDYTALYRCVQYSHLIPSIHLHFKDPISPNPHIAKITTLKKEKKLNNIRAIVVDFGPRMNKDFLKELLSLLHMLAGELEELTIVDRTHPLDVETVININHQFPMLRRIHTSKVATFDHRCDSGKLWPKLEEFILSHLITGSDDLRHKEGLMLSLKSQLRKIILYASLVNVNIEEDMTFLSSTASDLHSVLAQGFPQLEEVEIIASGIVNHRQQEMPSTDPHDTEKCNPCKTFNSLDILYRFCNLSINFVLNRAENLGYPTCMRCDLRYPKQGERKQFVTLTVDLHAYQVGNEDESVYLIQYMKIVYQLFVRHIKDLHEICVVGRRRISDTNKEALVKHFPELRFEFIETYAPRFYPLYDFGLHRWYWEVKSYVKSVPVSLI